MRQHLFSSLIIVLASLLPMGTYGAPVEKDHEQPEKYSRLTAYADSCMEQFDLFHAMRAYNKALKINDNCSLRRKIAKCHYRRAEFRECIETLKSISKLNNDSLDHEALREMFYSNGRLGNQSAQTYWGGVIIDKYPYDGEIVAALAAVYNSENINQPFKALEYTKKYLAVDSTNLAVLRQQADAYYFSNVFDRASEIYEKLINRGDSTFNTMYSLGMSCWNKKEFGKARTWLLRAAEKSNFTNAGCIYRLGVVCNEADSLTESKKYLRMAADMMQPDNRVLAIIYRNLGECFYKNKEYNSAAVAWETATKYGGGSAILFNIGQVYGLLGNKDKEIEWYKRYINSAELVDNSEEAKKMIEQARKVVGPEWESFNDELIKMINKKDSIKTNKTTSEKGK